MAGVSIHTIGYIEGEMGWKCARSYEIVTHTRARLSGVPKAKTQLGGNMLRWDDSVNMDIEETK
jgi:hypothetical protein